MNTNRSTQSMPSAEPLESRRLLAATIVNGVLIGTGTSGADAISVRRVLGDDVIVTINGAAQQFDMDNFTGVRLEGLGGNDTFSLLDPLVSPVVRNTTVLGGDGSDTIDYSTRTAAIMLDYNTEGAVGSTVQQGVQRDLFFGIETLLGGSGNDTFRYGSSGPSSEGGAGEPVEPETEIRIEGRGGNDLFVDSLATFQWLSGVTLLGGGGDDTFDADEIGNEQYFGGPGNDLFRFHNEAGPDNRFSGGDGIDTIDLSDQLPRSFTDMTDTPDIENAVGIRGTLIGNALGNRLEAHQIDSDRVTIIGGDGNDTIVGGSQADLLQGEAGNDSLVGNAGNDTLDGGAGTDSLSGGTGVNVFIDGEVIGGDPTLATIGIGSGKLVAVGTGGNDTFTIRRTGMDNVIITVNALSREFDMDDFLLGVHFEGLGGNDTFRMTDPLVSPVVRNTTVIGGAGHDTVSYETRTAAVRFDGYIWPDFAVPPFVEAVSGAQIDRVMADVEGFVGGSAGDRFGIDNLAEVEEDTYPLPDVVLEGRGGNDSFGSPYQLRATMHGGAGNDFYSTDEGALGDTFYGGDGDDRVKFNNFARPSLLDGGAGIDTVDVSEYILFTGSFVDMRTFAGVENLVKLESASSLSMLIVGNDLANHIDASGSTGGVTVRGLGGNDTLIGSDRGDLLEGGDGNDVIIGGAGDDELSGDGGNDWLAGQDGNDTLDGGAGTDTIDGGAGSNTNLNGEVLVGQQVAIGIVNRVLNVFGTGAGETISLARTGIDNVIARAGGKSAEFDMDDFDGVSVLGLGGNDVITIKQALVAGSLVRKVTIDGGGGNDSVTGASGNDVLRGNTGADTLLGLGGRDALFGGAGNDRLVGGLGLDFLDGGDNDDFLDAREGAAGDTVQGGNGSDTAEVDPGDAAANVESVA